MHDDTLLSGDKKCGQGVFCQLFTVFVEGYEQKTAFEKSGAKWNVNMFLHAKNY